MPAVIGLRANKKPLVLAAVRPGFTNRISLPQGRVEVRAKSRRQHAGRIRSSNSSESVTPQQPGAGLSRQPSNPNLNKASATARSTASCE